VLYAQNSRSLNLRNTDILPFLVGFFSINNYLQFFSLETNRKYIVPLRMRKTSCVGSIWTGAYLIYSAKDRSFQLRMLKNQKYILSSLLKCKLRSSREIQNFPSETSKNKVCA